MSTFWNPMLFDDVLSLIMINELRQWHGPPLGSIYKIQTCLSYGGREKDPSIWVSDFITVFLIKWHSTIHPLLRNLCSQCSQHMRLQLATSSKCKIIKNTLNKIHTSHFHPRKKNQLASDFWTKYWPDKIALDVSEAGPINGESFQRPMYIMIPK